MYADNYFYLKRHCLDNIVHIVFAVRDHRGRNRPGDWTTHVPGSPVGDHRGVLSEWRRKEIYGAFFLSFKIFNRKEKYGKHETSRKPRQSNLPTSQRPGRSLLSSNSRQVF